MPPDYPGQNMDDPKTAETQRKQPTYLVQPGQSTQLIDGAVLESKGELVLLSLFMSDKPSRIPHLTEDEGDEEIKVWLSYCHGRFAMTRSTFKMFRDLVSKQAEILQLDADEE